MTKHKAPSNGAADAAPSSFWFDAHFYQLLKAARVSADDAAKLLGYLGQMFEAVANGEDGRVPTDAARLLADAFNSTARVSPKSRKSELARRLFLTSAGRRPLADWIELGSEVYAEYSPGVVAWEVAAAKANAQREAEGRKPVSEETAVNAGKRFKAAEDERDAIE